VLCLDTPTAVLTLSAESLPKLPLSVEELYRQGQTNTDAELFVEHFEVDEVDHGLEGDSFFIASKAANFEALVPSVIGPAPLVHLKPPSAGLPVFGCGVALNGCCVGNEASIRP
jgi:hypothetical protein